MQNVGWRFVQQWLQRDKTLQWNRQNFFREFFISRSCSFNLFGLSAKRKEARHGLGYWYGFNSDAKTRKIHKREKISE